MHIREIFAAVTAIAFLFAGSVQDLRTAMAAEPGPESGLHVVGTSELHDAVVASSAEAATARQSLQDFLARSEVQRQIRRMGLEPADIQSRVALLSESEILRLQSQVMSADQRSRAAGIPGWTIVVITVFAVLGIFAVLAALASD